MNPLAGAKNMLQNCAGARPGERVLIAYEPAEYGYYDADAVPCVVDAAGDLGLKVDRLNVGFSPDNPQLTPELHAHFAQADIVVFLARLGDQLRFSDMPHGKRIIVSFALDAGLFGSGFGTTHHGAMMALKYRITDAFRTARRVRVTSRQRAVAGSRDRCFSGR